MSTNRCGWKIARASMAAGLAALAGSVCTMAQAVQPGDVDITPRLVADTLPGGGSGMTTISAFASAYGIAYFRASTGTGTQTQSIWRSNGRAGGTWAIAGTAGALTDPVAIPGTSNLLYFTNQSGATRTLKSVVEPSGQTLQVSQGVGMLGTSALVFASQHAFFLVTDASGASLRSTDGVSLSVISPSAAGTIGNVTPAGRYVYFTTRSGSGPYVLWRSQGTPETTAQVATLLGAPTWSVESSGMRAIGDSVLFARTVPGNGQMSEVWASDGTTAGTHVVTPVPSGLQLLAFPNDGAGLYSTRLSDSTTREFWRMSGQAAECRNLMVFSGQTVFTPFGDYGSMTLFGDKGGTGYGPNQVNSTTLWVTDGSTQNTLGVPGFPGTPAQVGAAAPANVLAHDKLYVESGAGSAGHEPWCVNLTAGSITMLRDIATGGTSSNPHSFFAMDKAGSAGFLATDSTGHTSLYVSDGTPDGTLQVSRLTGVTVQYGLKSVGSRLFLVGGAPGPGLEPFVVDLCPGDYDNSGSITVDDLFAYLDDWFTGNPNALESGTTGAPTMADLTTYVNSWFQGCSF